MARESSASRKLGQAEFVAILAAMMAVNGLGVDLMLPALAEVGSELKAPSANARQWVVTAYLLGFGVGQPIYGPLADRFGRKPVLIVALAGFLLATAIAASSSTFASLIAARVSQGVTAASSQVLTIAIVRDRYVGRKMAEITSLVQMIFFTVPILAPSIGQSILAFGSWRTIFYILALFTGCLMTWIIVRLPESLAPKNRRPIAISTLAEAYRQTLTDRVSLGYSVAGALTLGAIVAFVATAPQIFADTFGQTNRFPLLFGICAVSMVAASFANSRLVVRLGTRLLTQSALIALSLLSVSSLIIQWLDLDSVWTFVALQALILGCAGICGANFAAIAMERLGHIAATASSIQGFIINSGAVLVAATIGQAFEGSTLPLTTGTLLVGAGTLCVLRLLDRSGRSVADPKTKR